MSKKNNDSNPNKGKQNDSQKGSYIGETKKNSDELRKGSEIPPPRPKPKDKKD